MSLDNYIQLMRPAIEEELKNGMERWVSPEYSFLRSTQAYHMGWEGTGAGPEAQGKRIRPLLVLLCTEAAGGDWKKALPIAAGVEFIHNFSLVHDDIQDNSRSRRGRPTVWAKWGIPQAINAGDLMMVLAFLTLSQAQETLSTETAFKASNLLQKAYVQITQGQYLDLLYETEIDLPLEAYWPMIEGKTAALLGCCCEAGALAAGVDENRQEIFRKFGISLGLAFQVIDDWLGIWGDPKLTGKPTGSDLVSGKKTLPVLFALKQKKIFADRWTEGPIFQNEVERLAKYMIDEGAQKYTEIIADNLTKDALTYLKSALPEESEASTALYDLTGKLLSRRN